METKILYNNIQLFGWHVVADKGKNISKQFGTDIESDTDMETTIKKDDIILTTHYRIIYDKVVNVASIMRINLFEYSKT